MAETYFNTNNNMFFDLIRTRSYYDRHLIKIFEKKIFDKFPSDFFINWLHNIGITLTFTLEIIEKIKTGDIKWQNLLLYLVENGYYRKKSFNALAKQLVNNNMTNLLLLINIGRIDKNSIISIISDNKILIKLKQLGYDEKLVNEKLLLNNNNYDEVKNILLSSDKENIPEMISMCNVDIVKKLMLNNTLKLECDKILHKILSYACIYMNYNLITYLIKKNIFPSQNDLLHIFCITKKPPRKMRKSAILKSKFKYRSYRRQRFGDDKFNKKYSVVKSYYTIEHEDYLVDLIEIMVKNNICHPFEKNMNIVILKFFRMDQIYLAVKLMMCYPNTVKLNSNMKNIIIRSAVMLDDVELLMNLIELKIIKTEIFNTQKMYLYRALFSSSFNVAKYMVETLKMKISTSFFKKKKHYYYYDYSKIPSVFVSNHKKLIDFFIDNNLKIDKNILIVFISYGNLEALKYCEDKLKLSPSLKDIMSLLPRKYNGTSKKNYSKIFKYYYDKLDNVRSITSLVLSLLKKIDNKNDSFVLALIKHIAKDKRLKSKKILNYAFECGNVNIIKYFNQTHKIPMHTEETLSGIQKFITGGGNIYGGFHLFDSYRNFQRLNKLYNIYKYIELVSPVLFKSLKKMLISMNTNTVHESNIKQLMYSLCSPDITELQTFQIYNHIYEMFDHKINSENLINILHHSRVPQNLGAILKLVHPSDELIKKILLKIVVHSYETFVVSVDSNNLIKSALTLQILNNALFLKCCTGVLAYLINDAGIIPTPYSYHVFTMELNNYRARRYNKHDLEEVSTILKLLFTRQKQIAREDFHFLSEYAQNKNITDFNLLKFKIIDNYKPSDDELLDNEIVEINNNIYALFDINNNPDDLNIDNIIDDISDNDSIEF